MNATDIVDIPAKAAELAPDLDAGTVKWIEVFPGGGHWSYRVARGTTLRFIDLEGGANASLLLYRADEKLERLNLPRKGFSLSDWRSAEAARTWVFNRNKKAPT